MDVKAVMNNVKNKGIKETYNIYTDRKNKRNSISKNNNFELDILKKEVATLKNRVLELEKTHINTEIDTLFFNYNQADSQDILDKLIMDFEEICKKTFQFPVNECINVVEDICQRVAKLPMDDFRKGVYDIIFEYEKTKGYKKALKEKYIKNILPQIYNEKSKEPIKNTIVFMERGGKKSPSLNYIYDAVKKKGEYEIKLHELKVNVWPFTAFYLNAAKYIEDCATAKAIFICTANDLMSYFTLRPETTYIQLWHGCGAFKKVGASTVGKKFGKSAKARAEYPDHTNYSYVTIASPEVSWIFEESMSIDKESGIIVPTGISRTDEFFDKNYIENCYQKVHEIIPATKEKKIILYAPTFRGEVAKATSPDFLDVKKFYEALGDKYILIFKHHQSAKTIPEIPEEYKDRFAFDMTRGKGMTINDLMTVADIMITDYSSVVFEYSLFERPMAFLVNDIDEYIDERGLYYDFDEVTPGPLCYSTEELIDYIANIDERFDKNEVTEFKNKFMSCCDGHSTERILDLIK